MEIAIFSIPFIVSVFLLIFFRRETKWWEYLVLIVPSLIIAIGLEWCMKTYNISDIEFLGDYIVKVRHYDRWNEYIHRTCTKRVPCGTDSDGHTKYRTVTYDCSYVENHPERWTYYTSSGDEEYFYNQREFDKVRKLFNTPEVFVDMHRHYHTIDGDAQDYFWDGTIATAKPITWEHSYDNYVQSSRSIFKFEDIDDKEADSLGLFHYPKIYDYDQTPILGLKFPREQEQEIRWINGYYGTRKQFRMFLLFFKDKSESIVEKQRSYWQGGNKNELVVCIGYNTQTKKVDWCNAFSWCDEPALETRAKMWFINNTLNLSNFAKYIKPHIEKEWVRKKFKDFNYLSIELSDTQYFWLLFFVLLYNVGISIWIVINEYDNKEEYQYV